MIAREIYDLLIEGRIHVQKGFVRLSCPTARHLSLFSWDGVKHGPNKAAANPNPSIDILETNQPKRSSGGCCSTGS